MRAANGADYAEFQNEILSFYREHGRALPWRQTSDPYAILISEFMLQQTQTQRVIPKYARWLEEFPTVRALADAPFTQVLRCWVGLGYNRRARYLHECAKKIVREFDGAVPSNPAALRTLPGIGAYTAAAVAAFAYDKPTIFIETNIRAVFIHFFFSYREEVSDKEIAPLVRASLYEEDPRTWYYALMDYGAALKKRRDNPNRQSKHYVKQSQFKGSLRQARGAIIRALIAQPSQTHDELAANSCADTAVQTALFNRALEALLREGFVAKFEHLYTLAPNFKDDAPSAK